MRNIMLGLQIYQQYTCSLCVCSMLDVEALMADKILSAVTGLPHISLRHHYTHKTPELLFLSALVIGHWIFYIKKKIIAFSVLSFSVYVVFLVLSTNTGKLHYILIYIHIEICIRWWIYIMVTYWYINFFFVYSIHVFYQIGFPSVSRIPTGCTYNHCGGRAIETPQGALIIYIETAQICQRNNHDLFAKSWSLIESRSFNK